MKISIIVPIFNLENYIGKCIDSILNQTYKNLEIILVNDGSNDNSHSICEKYLADSRITYIYKENSGVSDSRNIGIKKSTGQYIMFVDGDDFLYNNTVIEKLVNKVSNETIDVLFYRITRYFENRNKYIDDSNIVENPIEYKNIYHYLNDTIKRGTLSTSPCDKIIKSEIVKDNKIYFTNSPIMEDIDWSLQLYKHVQNIRVLNDVIYVYRRERTESASNNVDKLKIEKSFYIINKWINNEYEDNKIKTFYYNYIAYQYSLLLALCNRSNVSKGLMKKILNVKSILKYNEDFRVKKVYMLMKLFGANITIVILKMYLKLKKKGIVNIQ